MVTLSECKTDVFFLMGLFIFYLISTGVLFIIEVLKNKKMSEFIKFKNLTKQWKEWREESKGLN